MPPRLSLIAVVLAGLVLSSSSASAAPSADAARKHCKKGYVLKHGKCHKKKSAGSTTPPATPATGAPDTPTAPGGPPGGTVQDQSQATRNDDAVKARLANGAFLERTTGGSVTLSYDRVFLYPNGTFRFEHADWNQVSGEICDSSKRQEGTWSFNSGYTFTAQGGGGIAVVNITANGQSGTEILTQYNQDQSHVYVGRNEVKYDVNPNMADNC
jgi:hypothetical protein